MYLKLCSLYSRILSKGHPSCAHFFKKVAFFWQYKAFLGPDIRRPSHVLMPVNWNTVYNFEYNFILCSMLVFFLMSLNPTNFWLLLRDNATATSPMGNGQRNAAPRQKRQRRRGERRNRERWAAPVVRRRLKTRAMGWTHFWQSAELDETRKKDKVNSCF